MVGALLRVTACPTGELARMKLAILPRVLEILETMVSLVPPVFTAGVRRVPAYPEGLERVSPALEDLEREFVRAESMLETATGLTAEALPLPLLVETIASTREPVAARVFWGEARGADERELIAVDA